MRSPHVTGELARWPTKTQMVSILQQAGLRVAEGRYSIRVEDCSHFVFQEYGNDLGCPCVDADADSLAAMMRDTERVSAALTKQKLKHRFEVYDECDNLAGYFHYEWPGVG